MRGLLELSIGQVVNRTARYSWWSSTQVWNTRRNRSRTRFRR